MSAGHAIRARSGPLLRGLQAAIGIAGLAALAAAAPPPSPPAQLQVTWYACKGAVLLVNGEEQPGEFASRDQQVRSHPIRRATIAVKPGDVIGLKVPADASSFVSPSDFVALIARSGGRIVFATDLRSWGYVDGQPPPDFWKSPMAASVKKARRANDAGKSWLQGFCEAAPCAGTEFVPIAVGKDAINFKRVLSIIDVQNAK